MVSVLSSMKTSSSLEELERKWWSSSLRGERHICETSTGSISLSCFCSSASERHSECHRTEDVKGIIAVVCVSRFVTWRLATYLIKAISFYHHFKCKILTIKRELAFVDHSHC